MSFTYLASPYTAPTRVLREKRFRMVARAAAKRMVTGEVVYSPIVHGHIVETVGDIGEQSHSFWMRQCFPMLRHAGKLVVLMLEGWESSMGVQMEIETARASGIPIEYMEYAE